MISVAFFDGLLEHPDTATLSTAALNKTQFNLGNSQSGIKNANKLKQQPS
jgi:hypothetical protein